MAYVSLYRKWRPQTFTEVTGQRHVVRTLVNALNRQRISHAYLFAGPRGTGKTTVARLLAKGANCQAGPTAEPCDECVSCQRIAAGNAFDVLEIDGASNRGIDEIRDLREKVRFPPSEGSYRVYIIDEVHMLTNEAFNALLKVLEEPPAHAVFVFATTEAHKLPPTILSRCQRFDFRRHTEPDTRERLRNVAEAEGFQVDEEALGLIAYHAEGGLRDALGILDQCAGFEDEKITAQVVADVLGTAPRSVLTRLVTIIAEGDAAGAFALVKELRDGGKDPRQFGRDVVRHLRDLMIARTVPDGRDLVSVSASEWSDLEDQAARLSLEQILHAMELFTAADAEMRWASHGQMVLETTLVKLVHPESAPSGAALAQRIASLEDRIATGGVSPVTHDTGRAGPAFKGHVDHGASGLPDPQALQEIWPEVVEALKQAKHPDTAAFLREGWPVEVLPDGTVTVAFTAERAFHRATLERDKHKQLVERTLSQRLGCNLRLTTRIHGEAAPAQPQADSQSADDRQQAGQQHEQPSAPDLDSPDLDEPTLRAALKLFGGKIINVKPFGEDEGADATNRQDS